MANLKSMEQIRREKAKGRDYPESRSRGEVVRPDPDPDRVLEAADRIERKQARLAADLAGQKKRLAQKRDNIRRELDYPREAPKAERMAKGRGVWSKDGITARVSPELPSCILRMRRNGTLSTAQVKGAEKLIADHITAWESGVRGTNYQERVDGGSYSEGDVEAAILDARVRYAGAKAACPAAVWEVVSSVLFLGADLTASGSYLKRFSGARSRKTAASAILGVGLVSIADYYGLT